MLDNMKDCKHRMYLQNGPIIAHEMPSANKVNYERGDDYAKID